MSAWGCVSRHLFFSSHSRRFSLREQAVERVSAGI